MGILGGHRNWVIGLALVGAASAATLIVPLAGCDRAVRVRAERQPEIRYRDIQRGTGLKAEEGRLVKVHYVGRLPDGDIFLDTRNDAQPYKWIIGDGTVIKGMDRAVVGMRPGGVREVTIPPELHWGRKGYADIVPENATLKFELTLVAVN